jgi:hypothetical protein
MRNRHPLLSALIALVTASLIAVSFADSPPRNTIPVITWRSGIGTECENITPLLICKLIWNYIDGIQITGWIADNSATWDPLHWCDSIGAHVIFGPSRLWNFGGNKSDWFARFDSVTIDMDNAYIQPDSVGDTIVDSMTAALMSDTLSDECSTLAARADSFDCIWFMNTWDEGPSYQFNRMTTTSAPYDDYMPNMYTQDTTMSHIDSTGVFAWIKYLYEQEDSVRAFSVNFASLHSISNWAGMSKSQGTTGTQANSVRAYLNTMYQGYDSISMPSPVSNYPDFLIYDAYPVRQVGSSWQDSAGITVTIGDSLNVWMLDHYEEVMDSTFIPAWEDSDGPYPIFFVPPCFGGSGGPVVWTISGSDPPDTTIEYESYSYRIPSPAEFRMICNVALLRGAKGIFPYSLLSYYAYKPGTDTLLSHTAGILDDNLIEFDAPYEDWVYRDRPTADYYHAPPDSIPPWTDVDGDDFDPLYEVPSRPTTTGAKYEEDYQVWKFGAYARLWNSFRETLGEIAIMAPELSRIWWWEGYEYEASIYSADSLEPIFVDPEIRIFKASGSDYPYLFYVNRQCRQTSNPMEIRVDDRDVPDADLTTLVLDHSRRFIIPVSSYRTIYYFYDSLGPGQARLVEFIDTSPATAADLRLTQPDVWTEVPGDTTNVYDFLYTALDSIDVYASVYNMGTSSVDSVVVSLTNVTDLIPVVVARDTLDFSGLSTSGYSTDADTASFRWVPSSSNTGIAIMQIRVVPVSGEPDTLDNEVTVPFFIEPRDYATTVLGAPWDMTESDSVSIPAWYTYDIDSLQHWESSDYTDSITGMFEGVIDGDSFFTNRLYLHMPTDSSDYLDGDTYNQFSLVGKCARVAKVWLGWVESDDTTDSVCVVDSMATGYKIWGAADLDSLWSGTTIRLLWLRFEAYLYPGSDFPVRIGQVRLTE